MFARFFWIFANITLLSKIVKNKVTRIGRYYPGGGQPEDKFGQKNFRRAVEKKGIKVINSTVISRMRRNGRTCRVILLIGWLKL